MKLQIFLQNLINKSEGSLKDELTPILNNINDVDIDDKFSSLTDSLLTIEAAKANRSVYEYAEKKAYDNISRSISSRVKDYGIGDEYLDSVKNQPVEDRIVSIFSKIKEDEGKKNTMSETDRVKNAEELRKIAEQRAETLREEITRRENNWKRESEMGRIEAELKHIASGLGFPSNIDRNFAIRGIVTEAKNRIEASGGKLLYSEAGIRVVQANDETSDFYDPNNKKLEVNSYLRDIAGSLGLVEAPRVIRPTTASGVGSNNQMTGGATETIKVRSGHGVTPEERLKATMNKTFNEITQQRR